MRSTHVVFAGLGLAGSTWASRLPQIRARMDLDPASLGLLFLAIAVGGVVVLPPAGGIVTRVGPRRAITAVALLVGAGLGAVAIGYTLWTPLVVAGLVLLGMSTGLWDVAVIVHAADIERRLGRSVMPRFFAGFSLGTVAGACLGALMNAWRVPVILHIGGIALLIALVTPAAARHFLPGPAPSGTGRPPTTVARPDPTPRRGPTLWRASTPWRDPRTVAIGCLALAFAVAEGAGSNWISLTVIDRHHTTATVGTLAYAAFLTAVTLSRWLGSAIVDRLGRVAALRAAAAATATGGALFALGPDTWTVFAGVLLWGAGAALGFPITLSAGADEPVRAADRVGVITSIGYCGFVGGPPLIGFLADRTGLAHALLVITVLMGGAVALSGAARPAPTSAPPPYRDPEHTKETSHAEHSAPDGGQ
ncbi:MFS transporter [Streptomyces sp. NPDC005483]|uniref:MFS transporter n=1 Tax=Streptomyces sp. NPDC005483 TaxID=3154882 RepID=UPI0033B3AB76